MSELIIQISIGVLLLYIFIQILNVASLLYMEADEADRVFEEKDLPRISILLAVRNEEANILRCLQSLEALHYPKDHIQILIGEDQSEDGTSGLIEKFIEGKPQFAMFPITRLMGKARGKANVLAHLAHSATGDYYLITDADVAVHPNWAREIVGYFNPKTGIVSGTTIVEDDGRSMGRMQEIDWMYFMGLLRSFANYGLNCTAVGNNMAIRKEAYWSTGGYENIDFSVTEDYKLYQMVRKNGWETRNILNTNIINRSRPIEDFRLLMHQRKRWLVGARELPIYWWLLFGIFGLFAPAIIIVFLHSIKLGLIFYGTKLLLQSLSVYILQDKMELRKDFDYLMTYEIYSIVVAISTQVFYFMPVSFQWKNRSYKL